MANRRISMTFVSAMARASRQTVDGSTAQRDANTSEKIVIAREKEIRGIFRKYRKEAGCTGSTA